MWQGLNALGNEAPVKRIRVPTGNHKQVGPTKDRKQHLKY